MVPSQRPFNLLAFWEMKACDLSWGVRRDKEGHVPVDPTAGGFLLCLALMSPALSRRGPPGMLQESGKAEEAEACPAAFNYKEARLQRVLAVTIHVCWGL